MLNLEYITSILQAIGNIVFFGLFIYCFVLVSDPYNSQECMVKFLYWNFNNTSCYEVIISNLTNGVACGKSGYNISDYYYCLISSDGDTFSISDNIRPNRFLKAIFGSSIMWTIILFIIPVLFIMYKKLYEMSKRSKYNKV